MADHQEAFGIGDLDRIIGPSMPSGGVIDIMGRTGSGKTMLGLNFLSRGISKGTKGLYVKFTTTSILPYLSAIDRYPILGPLKEYEEPAILDIKDERSLELLPPLMASGEIGNLILDHPDVMLLRGGPDWFRLLEETLISARDSGVNVLILEYEGKIGSYLSEGILGIERGGDGLCSIEVIKWDWDASLRGKRIQEPEVGSWRI